jgi:hypothetical protein
MNEAAVERKKAMKDIDTDGLARRRSVELPHAIKAPMWRLEELRRSIELPHRPEGLFGAGRL